MSVNWNLLYKNKRNLFIKMKTVNETLLKKEFHLSYHNFPY